MAYRKEGSRADRYVRPSFCRSDGKHTCAVQVLLYVGDDYVVHGGVGWDKRVSNFAFGLTGTGCTPGPCAVGAFACELNLETT